MGLDMYLSKKIYVGANYDHRKIKGKISLTKDGKKMNIPLNKITYIELDYGYWRKDNHIHKWFVDNVQDGEDDCREAWVTIDNLQELKELCQKTKEYLDSRPQILVDETTSDYLVYDVEQDVMEDLLPTQSGFFFGGTSYDKWYYESLDATIEIIDECIKSEEEESGEYYYHSSW